MSTGTKYYGIFNKDGGLVRNKFYTDLGVARNVLSRWKSGWPNRAEWEVREVRSITTQPTPNKTLDLRRHTFEHHNWRNDTFEEVETSPEIPILDVITNTQTIRITVNGDITYGLPDTAIL